MSDHHKISSTAWLVAKMRSLYTELPYAREIAQELNKEKKPFVMNIITYMLKYVAARKPHKTVIITMLESRYLCLEDALPEGHDFVLVELASGLSARGIVHAKEGRMIIESDLPDMLGTKKNLLNTLYKEEMPSHHHLVSANVMNAEDFDKLGELYLEKGGNKPLYILHEGLLPYFSKVEKEVFRNNIAAFLRKYAPGKGYWITPDLYEIQDKQNPGIIKRVIKAIEHATGKEVSAFDSFEEIQEYLGQSDLTGQMLPNDHILDNLVSLKRLGLSKKELPYLITRLAACVIEPREQAEAGTAKSKKSS